jgi:hypothetical protein
MIQTSIVYITPEMAGEMLKRNTNNLRRIERPRVAFYVAQIKANKFRTTHQGIAFHKDGRLVDGQHRLAAIYESGIGVWLQVTDGLEDEDVVVLDQNRVRRSCDIARSLGRSETQTQFAIARILLTGPAPRGYLPITDLLEVIDKLRAGIEFATEGGNFRGFTSHVRAPIARAFYTEDADRIGEFKQVFSDGSARSPKDWAAVRLRDAISRRQSATGSAARLREYYLTEKALRLFLDGYPCKSLYPVKDEIFRIPGFDNDGAEVEMV